MLLSGIGAEKTWGKLPEPPWDFPSLLMARTWSRDPFLNQSAARGTRAAPKVETRELNLTCISAIPEKSDAWAVTDQQSVISSDGTWGFVCVFNFLGIFER